MNRISKRLVFAGLLGFVVGMVVLIVLRFVMYKSPDVHYHANFALYVNGQQDKFDNFTFYEEVASCSGDDANNPKLRAHMHDKTNHVVHVHASGVTWGSFFANLGYTLGNQVIKTDNGIYASGQDGNKLRFILNGDDTESIANEVIRSQDTLLIDYGNTSEQSLTERFNAIPRDAGQFNQRQDPSSCKGSQAITFTERLKKSISITD